MLPRGVDFVSSIKQLYTLSTLLCLTPPFDFETRISTRDYIFKTRALIVAVLIVAGFIDYFARLQFQSSGITTTVLRLMAKIVFGFTPLQAVLSAAFWNLEEWSELVAKMCKLGVRLEARGLPKWILYAEIIGGHVYCIFMIIYYVYINLHEKPIQQLVYYNVIIYYIFIAALLNYNFAQWLKNMYSSANIMLRKCDTLHAKDMADIFLILNEISIGFNTVFGWNIFYLTVNIVVEMLLAFDSLVVGTTSKTAAEFIAINFLIALMFLVFGIIVIVSCDMAIRNAQTTAPLAYRLLLDAPRRNDNLRLLAQHASNIQKLSAAGFFDVDISLLLSIFGVVASNLVIIIQLNQ